MKKILSFLITAFLVCITPSAAYADGSLVVNMEIANHASTVSYADAVVGTTPLAEVGSLAVNAGSVACVSAEQSATTDKIADAKTAYSDTSQPGTVQSLKAAAPPHTRPSGRISLAAWRDNTLLKPPI